MKILLAMLILIAAFCRAEEAPRPVQTSPYFGMHIHRADEGTAWPAVAMGSWRLWDAHVSWPQLQPGRFQWNFTKLDRYVAMAKITRVDILLPLGLSPSWASARPAEKSGYSPGFAAEPASISDWRMYVKTVAERYKGKIYNYEIWNEVNVPAFYSGSPQKLKELTCEAYRIIKETDPKNKLVFPSVVSDSGFFEKLLKLDIARCTDVIGYHFYTPLTGPEQILSSVNEIKALLKKYHIEQPIWNTESGWWMENADGTSEAGADPRWRRITVAEGPAIVARHLILGRHAGLSRFYWYAWDSSALGLIEPELHTLKPAAIAYDQTAKWLGNNVPLCAVNQGLWRCVIACETACTIVWKSQSGGLSSFAMPVGHVLTAVKKLDGTILQSAELRSIRAWKVSEEPVLVVSEPAGFKNRK